MSPVWPDWCGSLCTQDSYIPVDVIHQSSCRAIVYDARPSLNQHWINGACLAWLVWLSVGTGLLYPVDVIHQSSDGSMFGHRLRRWSNIKPPLDSCRLFDLAGGSVWTHGSYIPVAATHKTLKR